MSETITTKYITGTDPRKGFDGVAPLASAKFCRMTMYHDSIEPYDQHAVANVIEGASDRVLFFVDNGFIDEQTSPRIYEALLSRKGRAGVIGRVHDELKPWMAAHPSHVFTQAVQARSEAILFTDIDTTNSEKVATAEYYLNLLYLRKKLIRLAAGRFEHEHRRAPNEVELKVIRDRLHNFEVGPRGYALAKKGEAESASANRFTDETLVVTAVTSSLYESRETVILTKDQDVLEQFYKMQYLLDTHYRGMLLADRYREDPKSLSTTPMPTDNPWLSEVFDVADSILVEPRDYTLQDLLPAEFTTSPYQCWFFGKQTNKLVRLAVTADTAMRRVLEVKGRTSGLNSDRLDGKNCHVWLAPLLIEKRFRKCAITRDRGYRLGPREVPYLDALQAINCQEGFVHLQHPAG